MKKELLAPAGDIEAGYAALYYGADAVYLGLQKFSARATAANFDENSLNEFVGYAHHLGRKVYAAINTVVQEHELTDLLLTLDICSRCRVDAVILQDLGVAEIIRTQYPELEMHASTQMAVHNKEGALALQKLGFTRVVVARELSLREIKEIAAIPGLETEAFIHGALCYSYSGLCMFSSFENGRSANRGKCLYPCRAVFDGEAGEKHYFSMKDMALQENVVKMPVTSLKIEGRKKTALYVAAVTDYYRHILDGDGADIDREEHIKQIFSRPWCQLHFNGKNKDVIDRDFVGHRGLLIGKIEQLNKHSFSLKTNHKIARYDGIQIDIPGEEKPFGFSLQGVRVKGKNVYEAQPNEVVEIMLPPQKANLRKGLSVYLASATSVKGAYDYSKPKPREYCQRYPLDVTVSVFFDKVIAESCGQSVCISGSFTAAADANKAENAIRSAFAKTGDTVFALRTLDICNSEGLFVPLSLLNELRRELYAAVKPEYKYGSLPVYLGRQSEPQGQWIIKTDNPLSLSLLDMSRFAEIILLLSPESRFSDVKNLPKNKVRLALPAVCRNPVVFAPLIKSFVDAGYRKWEIANYWGLGVLPKNGIDLSFDTPLYVLNSAATSLLKDMHVSRAAFSVEDTMANIMSLNNKSLLPMVLPVYQDVPLFTSANCIRSNDCKQCDHQDRWFNLRKDGEKYRALSSHCQLMLFSDKPLCIANEAFLIKTDYYRMDFCYKNYTAEQVYDIANRVMHFEDVPNSRKGNFARSVDLF